jgi:hypothetical protein
MGCPQRMMTTGRFMVRFALPQNWRIEMTNIKQIAITADNDRMIGQLEVAMKFPAFEKAVEGYHKVDASDAERMLRVMKLKETKARRAAQSGVDPDISAIERELSKIVGHEVFAVTQYSTTTLLGVRIEFEERINKTSWRYRSTGIFDLYIGDRWDGDGRKRLPQKADRTYSYDKAAAEINSRFMRKLAAEQNRKEAEAKKAAAADLVNQLKEEFKLEKYDDTFTKVLQHTSYKGAGRRAEYSEYAAQPGKVWMSLGNKQVTPEQARIVMAALKEAGLIK